MVGIRQDSINHGAVYVYPLDTFMGNKITFEN